MGRETNFQLHAALWAALEYLGQPTTAYNSQQQPTTAYNSLQQPKTAYNSLKQTLKQNFVITCYNML